MQPCAIRHIKRKRPLFVTAAALSRDLCDRRHARVSHRTLPTRCWTPLRVPEDSSRRSRSSRASAAIRTATCSCWAIRASTPGSTRRRGGDDRAGLRFLNGGVPGTTPRCWPFFLRADRSASAPLSRGRDCRGYLRRRRFGHRQPRRRRPSDGLALRRLSDAAERSAETRRLVLRSARARRVRHRPVLARAGAARRRAIAGGRIRCARAVAPSQATRRRRPTIRSPPIRVAKALDGLRVNFATGAIAYPAGTERRATQRDRHADADNRPSRARRTRRIACDGCCRSPQRYAETGTPVFFVRIPTRPAHRETTQTPERIAGGDRAAKRGARFLPAAAVPGAGNAGAFRRRRSSQRRGKPALQPAARQRRRDGAGAILRRRSSATSAPAACRSALRLLRREHHSLSWFAAARRHRHSSAALPRTSFGCSSRSSPRCFTRFPSALAAACCSFASYYFYARWNAWYVVFLWILTLSDYSSRWRWKRDANVARAAAVRCWPRRRRESRVPR